MSEQQSVSSSSHPSENFSKTLAFITVDGTAPDFLSRTWSFVSNAQTVSSKNTEYQINKTLYNFKNLTVKHKYWELITIVILMLGYAGRYFSTSHFYLIEDAWAKDEEISISDQKIMFGVTVLLLMISKISLGLVADRYFVPGLIFTVTNIICALSGLGFIFGNKIGWYIAAYAITGLAIPGSWIGIIGVVARWIPISRQGRTMGTISTVYLVGDAITSIVIKSLIEIEVPWRGIVCVCAVTCFLTNIPAIFFLFSTPKRLNLPEPPTRTMNLITTSSKPNSFLDIVRPLSKSRAFWFLNVLALTIYGVNEFFMIFSKKYLIKIYCTSHELTFYETFDDCMTSHVASNYAFWASLILPISGIASSLATGYLKDGIAKRHRSTLIVSFLIGLLLFLMIMQLFFPCPMPIACIFIVCCGITLIGPYTLLSGAFILDVGGKYRSASASSFVNTTGFLGGLLVLLFCKHVENEAAIFCLMVLLVLFAVVIASVMWYLEAKSYYQRVKPSEDKCIQVKEDEADYGSSGVHFASTISSLTDYETED